MTIRYIIEHINNYNLETLVADLIEINYLTTEGECVHRVKNNALYRCNYTFFLLCNSAIKNDKIDIFEYTYSKFDITNNDEFNELLSTAVEYNRVQMFKVMLNDAKYNIIFNDFIVLETIENGFIEIFKIIIDSKKFNLSIINNYPIRIAADNCQVEMVEMLLKLPEVDPSVADNDAIYNAGINGCADAVILLLQDRRVVHNIDERLLYINTVYDEMIKITGLKSREEILQFINML